MARPNDYQHEVALTDMQEKFARGLAGGLPQTEAARIAGYADPRVVAVRLARHEGVRERVRALRTNEIDKLASLSLRVLKDILRKQGVSDAVRLNAVKLSLALAGHTEKPSEEAKALKTKDIEGMSVAELDAFLLAERSKRADAAKPVFDHETVQSPTNQLITLDHSPKMEPIKGSGPTIEGEAVTIGDDTDPRPG